MRGSFFLLSPLVGSSGCLFGVQSRETGPASRAAERVQVSGASTGRDAALQAA